MNESWSPVKKLDTSESWSPMKNRDPKINVTSDSVGLNDNSSSSKDRNSVNESWSPVENRDPRLLAKNRRSDETKNSHSDNSKVLLPEEDENWD